MKYISTRGGSSPLSFIDAVMTGLAEDGGLLLPEIIPSVADRLDDLAKLDYPSLAYEIIRLFVDETDIDNDELRALITRSYATFDTPEVAPVVNLGKNLFVAELFHGPTLAFKDVALQFLGNLFEYILEKRGGKLNILGATSGDTGSAAIHGVCGKKNIDIFIMYPEGRVSPLQERQMATVPDKNVHCIAINGTFDDGQRVLKEVFNDLPFKKSYSLGAVNSVNWARILAQVVYYFWAPFKVSQMTGYKGKMQISVPTGNFGDIFAGYIAMKMGAPVSRLILATNENDILSRFFKTGEYSIGTVSKTLSPSMDIQVASNFERYLYFRVGQSAETVKFLMAQFAKEGKITLPGKDEDFLAGRGNTAMTLATIKKYQETKGYLLDPHGAVGVAVAEQVANPEIPVICLETAHPGKFPAAVDEALPQTPGLAFHAGLNALTALPLRKTLLNPERQTIENFIKANV